MKPLADVAMQTEVINGHLIEVTIGGHTEYLTASMLGAAKRKLASVTSCGWVNVNGLRLDESQVDHCIGMTSRHSRIRA